MKNINHNQGYVRLHRKLKDSLVYSDSQWLHVWVDVLFHTTWKCKKIVINGKPKTIHAGEQITSHVNISKRTGVGRSKVRRILWALSDEQQIEQQTNNRFAYIKVPNWTEYQGYEQQDERLCNSCVTAGEQQVNTTNKDKKDNKREKNSKNSLCRLSRTEVFDLAIAKQIDPSEVTRVQELVLNPENIRKYKHKTTYWTVKKWLETDIHKGRIQQFPLYYMDIIKDRREEAAKQEENDGQNNAQQSIF